MAFTQWPSQCRKALLVDVYCYTLFSRHREYSRSRKEVKPFDYFVSNSHIFKFLVDDEKVIINVRQLKNYYSELDFCLIYKTPNLIVIHTAPNINQNY